MIFLLQVKENRKQFAEIVSDRLKLYVNAFCAENITSAMASVSQAKSLENSGKNLLRSIELKQVSSSLLTQINSSKS